MTVLDAGFDRATGEHAPAAAEQPFLVMELVEGPTLAARFSAGPLRPDEVGSIGVQVAEALATGRA